MESLLIQQLLETPMARFSSLILLAGLLGFSIPQLMACAEEDSEEKADEGEGEALEDEVVEEPGNGGSPEDVCAHIKKQMEEDEYTPDDGFTEICTMSMTQMEDELDELDEELWKQFSSCALSADSQESLDACGDAIDDEVNKRKKDSSPTRDDAPPN
jgi:hypothetical protein